MDGCRGAVHSRPSGTVLASLTYTGAALVQAKTCSHCTLHAVNDLEEFMTILIAEVDKAVAKVRAAF